MTPRTTPTRRRSTVAWALALALIAWCALWIWMGVAVARDIRGLERLSDTVASAGRAAQETGDALEALAPLPVVGERIPEAAQAVREAGRSATESAQASRQSVRRTGLLLGISIAAIAILPALVAYVPRRLAAGRERRRVAAIVAGGRDDSVDAQLALRAILSHSPDDLRAITSDPLGDLRAGRARRLADAELARLGVSPAARE